MGEPTEPAAKPESLHPAFPAEKANLAATVSLVKTESARIRQLKLNPKQASREDQIIHSEWKHYGRQLEAVLDRPYFGRIDIRDASGPDLTGGLKGPDGMLNLYIGTVPVYTDRTRLYNRVTDWRAPVARLFYEGEVGPQSFKVEEDWVDVVLYLVRHLDIEKGTLRGVFDQQVHPDYPQDAVAPVDGQDFLADDYLRSLLKTAAGSHLRDIVRSIQREQHAIIAEGHDHTVIVQGVAGSGKTSIALHRVAQVLYNLRLAGVKRPSALVVAPTPLFLSYIAEVLPSLFEEGVPQTTFEDWAGGLVFGEEKKDWPVVRLEPPVRPEDLRRVKFKESLIYRRLLDEGLQRLEDAMVPDHDVLIGDARIPAAQIRGWIQGRADRPLMVRTERAVQLLRTWLKNRGFDDQPEVAAWALRTAERWRPRPTLDVYRDILLAPDLGVDRWLGKGETDRFKAHAQQLKEAGAVEAADLAGLVYLRARLYGSRDSERWDHIVVDEAQDFAALRYAVLAPFARQDSLTIVGDLGQRAREELGLPSWDEVIGPVFPKDRCRLHQLHRSYRTTQKIIQTAHQALVRSGAMATEPPDSLIPGEPPLMRACDAPRELAAALSEWLQWTQTQGFASTAVITKTVAEADEVWRALQGTELTARTGVAPQLIRSAADRYEGGVVVLPVVLARGLEFDATAVAGASQANFPATPENGRLLYIAMTRAKAALAVFWTGAVSPLVATE
ncbi:MAG: HelD family protein [Symbiobacteriia bacterium]